MDIPGTMEIVLMRLSRVCVIDGAAVSRTERKAVVEESALRRMRMLEDAIGEHASRFEKIQTVFRINQKVLCKHVILSLCTHVRGKISEEESEASDQVL